MKRSHILLSLLFFASVMSANAQMQMTLVPIIGLNSFRLTPDPVKGKSTSGVGYTIGAAIRFGSRFYFAPGLHYLHQSTEITFDTTTSSPTVTKTTLSTIRLPLLLGAKLFAHGDGDGILNAHINAGVTPTILLSTSDAINNYSTFNVAATIGGGIEALFLTFDIFLDYGLTKAYTIPTYSAKPYTLEFNIGVKIPI